MLLGGHLNPAVTLALAITRRFEWKKLPVYWLAQYLGALAASGTVLGVYYGIFKEREWSFWHWELTTIYLEAIMQGKVNGEFRIHKDSSDPGWKLKRI